MPELRAVVGVAHDGSTPRGKARRLGCGKGAVGRGRVGRHGHKVEDTARVARPARIAATRAIPAARTAPRCDVLLAYRGPCAIKQAEATTRACLVGVVGVVIRKTEAMRITLVTEGPAPIDCVDKSQRSDGGIPGHTAAFDVAAKYCVQAVRHVPRQAAAAAWNTAAVKIAIFVGVATGKDIKGEGDGQTHRHHYEGGTTLHPVGASAAKQQSMHAWRSAVEFYQV